VARIDPVAALPGSNGYSQPGASINIEAREDTLNTAEDKCNFADEAFSVLTFKAVEPDSNADSPQGFSIDKIRPSCSTVFCR
jgi:hypothetical protein